MAQPPLHASAASHAGLLDARGTEPADAPAAALGQRLVGCGALALRQPQTTQTQRCPQLPRPGLVTVGFRPGRAQ